MTIKRCKSTKLDSKSCPAKKILALMASILFFSCCCMAGGLDGAFIWLAWNPDWGQARWSEEMAMMRDIGMDTVIITFSVDETSAYYPTAIPGLTPVGTNPIEKILSDADANGMEIFLGLAIQNEWWANTSEAYLDGLTALNIAIATELYSLYSSHSSLKGFYLPQEIDNCRWADAPMQQRLVDRLLKPVSDHVESLDSNLVFCEAPFYNPTCLQPAEYEQWWIETLNEAPNFDLVIPQDGIGAQPSLITLSVIEDYFTALKAACDATGRTLWSDLEVFEKVGVLDPPPTPDRILSQIALEEPLVEKIVVWEWGYIAPYHSVRALDFVNNYKRYCASQNLLENVSDGQIYSVDPPPTAPYLDSGSKLADGTASFDYGAQVGWASVSSVTISLDLGLEYTNLNNFRAYFLRADSSGVSLPSSVSVSLSQDGIMYTPVGLLEPIASDNQSINPYQVLLSTPVCGRYAKYDITPGGYWTMGCEVSAYSAILDLISEGKSYVFSAPPSGSYPDSGGELTNNEWPFTWDAQVGWADASGALEITLDLEGSYYIGRLEAYFMRSDSSAVHLPLSVNASVSDNGLLFTSLGSLSQQSADDDAVNLYTSRTSGTGRYLKVEVTPDTGWLMLCEIRIFGEESLGSVANWSSY